jgi:signal transduction histidine kinase
MTGVERSQRWSAALLGVAAVAETLFRYADGGSSAQFVVFAGLVAVATTMPLWLPRPVVSAVAIAVAGVLSLTVVGTLTAAGALAQLVAAYRLGRRGSLPVAAALGLPYLVVAAFDDSRYVRVVAILLAALVPALALTGVAWRVSRATAESTATERALAGTLLEHTVRGERARIARELHDVVAHHISMIAVQAESARLTTPGLPPAGAQRLSAIGDTARDALTEMRRLLGVLREDAAPVPAAATAPLVPQPGLAQLNALLDAARSASGSGTRLILSGAPTTLDPGVELAAYRIVQEALTNARRHAPGAAVDVSLRFTGEALELTVRDNGPGATGPGHNGSGLNGSGLNRSGLNRAGLIGAAVDGVADSAGHGLLGMNERAVAVGGTLRAGPAAGGGFLVRASLPVKGSGDAGDGGSA